jgi:regulatory protein
VFGALALVLNFMRKFSQRAAKTHQPESGSREALNKIFRYCAYQERSHREVKNKLFEYGLSSSQVDEVLSHLITEGFLNEERYARAFAGGKFRIMKWGRLKIQKELESSGVSPRNIARGLMEITPAEYSKTLLSLMKRKSGQIADENLYRKKNRVARFLIGKGYEPELVWAATNDFLD